MRTALYPTANTPLLSLKFKQSVCKPSAKLLMLFFMFFFFACSFLETSAQNREIIWSDEFDYEGLPDPEKWSYDIGGHGWGNNELQYYTENRLENARVENGKLIIEAHYELYKEKLYTSARLVSKNKGDWLYGYFEMRAKLPSGRGTWPAFWMLPTDWEYGGWPDSGEIDIMEHVGYDEEMVHATVHTQAYNHMIGTQVGVAQEVSDCETAYHIYACEWNENEIKMYIDGDLYFSFQNQGHWTRWPFDKRFHILLNIAVGGSWGGVEGIDKHAFPSQFSIDYIRVYAPGSGPSAIHEREGAAVLVYPNPTKDILSIEFPAVHASQELRLKIFDVLGKQLMDTNLWYTGTAVDINLAQLQSGVYTYSILTKDQIIKQGKILIQ